MLGSDRFGFMAIQLSKKQSDLEKRLKLLHNQVYGKERTSNIKYSVSNSSTPAKNTVVSDMVYLHQDLLKIFILSGGAIAIQIVLYFSLQHHVLTLKLF